MEKVLTQPDRCKECDLCIVACPKNAIFFSEDINKAGNRYTVIDQEKCIACGICYTICPDGVYEILGDK